MGDTAATAVQVVQQVKAPSLMGRTTIYTDKTTEELAKSSVMLDELDRVFPIHLKNSAEIKFLQDYYRGYHPKILSRVKKSRTDVDNKVVVDYAYSFTRDITGYFLGKSVRYVQRGVNDGGTAENDELRTQVETLNHIYDIENKPMVDLQVATDMSINGVGYKGVFSEKNPRNGTHLHLRRLDPESTFVVYSSGNTKIPMYAVSYWKNNVSELDQVETTVCVYTQTKQYIYTVTGDIPNYGVLTANGFALKSESTINFNGSLPVIEYPNNAGELGDWEVAISLMDAIDTLSSDGVNDIEQFVNNILVAIGFEFNDQVQETLDTVGVLNIEQLPAGMEYPPEIRYISQQLDSASGEAIRDYLESTLRVIVGVPDRKTRGGGGGDTGDAVFLRDGWQDIDLVASNKEAFFVKAEREAMNVSLYILRTNDEIGEGIKPSDIEIKFNRNKTTNLLSKVQALQSMWDMLDHADALELSDLTTNVQDVIIRAEKAHAAQQSAAQPNLGDNGEDNLPFSDREDNSNGSNGKDNDSSKVGVYAQTDRK